MFWWKGKQKFHCNFVSYGENVFLIIGFLGYSTSHLSPSIMLCVCCVYIGVCVCALWLRRKVVEIVHLCFVLPLVFNVFKSLQETFFSGWWKQSFIVFTHALECIPWDWLCICLFCSGAFGMTDSLQSNCILRGTLTTSLKVYTCLGYIWTVKFNMHKIWYWRIGEGLL